MIPDEPVRPFAPLLECEVAADPFAQFNAWLTEAVAEIKPEPFAMTLATCTPAGKPSARMVLLRGFDEHGFCFYTCYESRKGEELKANPHAALVFYWGPLHRQVRIEGSIMVLSAEESDHYYHRRPRESQFAAWASPQSRVVDSRAALEERFRAIDEKFAGTGEIPRPANWGGFRVVPDIIEFWQGRQHRLHDRLRYTRQPDGAWQLERLAP